MFSFHWISQLVRHSSLVSLALHERFASEYHLDVGFWNILASLFYIISWTGETKLRVCCALVFPFAGIKHALHEHTKRGP